MQELIQAIPGPFLALLVAGAIWLVFRTKTVADQTSEVGIGVVSIVVGLLVVGALLGLAMMGGPGE